MNQLPQLTSCPAVMHDNEKMSQRWMTYHNTRLKNHSDASGDNFTAFVEHILGKWSAVTEIENRETRVMVRNKETWRLES